MLLKFFFALPNSRVSGSDTNVTDAAAAAAFALTRAPVWDRPDHSRIYYSCYFSARCVSGWVFQKTF